MKATRWSVVALILMVFGIGLAMSVHGGEIVVATSADHTISRWEYMGGISPYSTDIFETLVYLDPDHQPHPGLAKSWESIDELTWRLYLRDDVTFHSGAPFNAEACKLAIEAVRDQGITSFLYLNEATVVDEYTIDISTTTAFGAFPEHLSHQAVAMANFAQDADAVVPDGTGPFKYESHIPGQEVVVVKNDNYWGEAAKLDKITFQYIPEAATRVLALQGGQVDVAFDVPFESIQSLETDSTIDVYIKPSGSFHYFSFVLYREPVNDVLVRKAINHAIDRDLIAEFVLEGYAEATQTMVVPQMPWSLANDPSAGYEFNQAEATRLLNAAGWSDSDGDGILDKDGQPLSFQIAVRTGNRPEYVPVAEAVQGMLLEVGIEVELLAVGVGPWISELRGDGTAAMILDYTGTGCAEGDYALSFLWHSEAWMNGNNPVLAAGEYMDTLIEMGLAERDQETRYGIYRAIQWIIQGEAMAVPVHLRVNTAAAGAHVEDFQLWTTDAGVRWREVNVK
ncbi:ABC transporter substrate-binding protein [Candidatus Bipolaricaulota bacterium]